MNNDLISFVAGVSFFVLKDTASHILYLILSAATEMGTKVRIQVRVEEKEKDR